MDFYIARQPIYDTQSNVYGYELLYRENKQNFYNSNDGNTATSDVITGTFLFIGIDSITYGKKAFINFTQTLIEQDIATLFPNEYLVIEILEDVAANKEVIKKCRDLKNKGYIIALDDFCYKEGYEALIEIADIIKIDFLSLSKAEINHLMNEYKSPDKVFIAEKIETYDDFCIAKEMGFDLFQGYYLSKPVILNKAGIDPIKSNHIRLMDAVLGSVPDFRKIAKIIESDVAFSYEILRIVNTLKYYRGDRIKSVNQALVMLGLYQVKKWIYITVLRKNFSGNGNENLIQSLTRAKFMETLSKLCYRDNLANDCFTIGIFSLIDVLMDRPMETLLEELPLTVDIKAVLSARGQALINLNEGHNRKIMHELFALVLDYEKGLWTNIDHYALNLRIDREEIKNLYLDSLAWAYEIFDI